MRFFTCRTPPYICNTGGSLIVVYKQIGRLAGCLVKQEGKRREAFLLLVRLPYRRTNNKCPYHSCIYMNSQIYSYKERRFVLCFILPDSVRRRPMWHPASRRKWPPKNRKHFSVHTVLLSKHSCVLQNICLPRTILSSAESDRRWIRFIVCSLLKRINHFSCIVFLFVCKYKCDASECEWVNEAKKCLLLCLRCHDRWYTSMCV